MGYAFYALAAGREAGYGVQAPCDVPSCDTVIDRGLSYLCGSEPSVRMVPDDGCGFYFCGNHEGNQHQCTPQVAARRLIARVVRNHMLIEEECAGPECDWEAENGAGEDAWHEWAEHVSAAIQEQLVDLPGVAR